MEKSGVVRIGELPAQARKELKSNRIDGRKHIFVMTSHVITVVNRATKRAVFFDREEMGWK